MSDPDLSLAVSWQESLKDLFQDFTPVSLTSVDGSVVHIEGSDVADLTLSACARICQQYLKMKPGDMAIINDPSSAGTALNEICLVRAISLAPKAIAKSSVKNLTDASSDFLLALRFQIGGSPNLKAEINSLRIPPTPLAVADQMNSGLLSAMSAHPGASFDFQDKVLASVEKLRELEKRLERLKQLPGLSFSKDQLDFYFESTQKSLLAWISKTLSNGEFHFQHKLSSGDLVKLKIECRESESILFDFVGTGASDTFQLTEFLSLSACFAALNSLSGFEIPANQGSLAAIQVRTPQNSLLNSKRLQNSYLAKNVHLLELSDFLRQSLLKLARATKNFAENARPLGPQSLEFSSSKIFDLTLLGGQGGSNDKNGAAGFSFWTGRSYFSIEQAEKSFDLKFTGFCRRSTNLGKGRHLGGPGLQLSLTLKAPALLSSHADLNHRAQGLSQGKQGEKPEIVIESLSQAFQKEMTSSFSEKLDAETNLRLQSGGGGGWGEEKIESEED
jgi:N-methylhydantoinase B